MKHCFIILLLEFCCTALVLSQGTLREFVVEKDDNPLIPQVIYRGCTPDDGVIVFYTSIPDLKFSMPDTPNRLKNVSPFDRENNCYVLCIQPTDTRIGGIMQYSIDITGNEYKPISALMVSSLNAGVTQYFNIKPKYDLQSAIERLEKEIAELKGQNSGITSTYEQIAVAENKTDEQVVYKAPELTGNGGNGRNGEYYNPDGIEVVYVEGNSNIPDFYIGKFEVTQAQWKAIMGKYPRNSFKGDLLPVQAVSWNDIQKFISSLNKKTGREYRLPTEAEWEYAARGGNHSGNYTYSGSNNLNDVAWYASKNQNGRTVVILPQSVGTKSPNELGIYDMSGNVWEWCADKFGRNRVFRGGAGNQSERNCLPNSRNNSRKYYRNKFLGFRLALTPQKNSTFNEGTNTQNIENMVTDNATTITTVTLDAVSERITRTRGNGRNSEVYNPDRIEVVYVEVNRKIPDFYIGKFEVTQAQWKAIMGEYTRKSF